MKTSTATVFAMLLSFGLIGAGGTASANAGARPDEKVMKAGKVQYMICAACHGQGGEGTAAAPPLAGSEWVNGPVENLIRIQLRGLVGPIRVKGELRGFEGGMAPLAYQTDEQIAAVLTFVRNSFGNSAPPVEAEQVKSLRGEVGKPQVTAAELIQPDGMEVDASAPVADSKVYDDLRPSGFPKWIIAAVLALSGAAGWFLKRKA